MYPSQGVLNLVKYIDKSKYIKFWFKNGDSDETYFALPYKFKKQIKVFNLNFFSIIIKTYY